MIGSEAHPRPRRPRILASGVLEYWSIARPEKRKLR
jgi:hypothetical protein